jgi:hypothetical protein
LLRPSHRRSTKLLLFFSASFRSCSELLHSVVLCTYGSKIDILSRQQKSPNYSLLVRQSVPYFAPCNCVQLFESGHLATPKASRSSAHYAPLLPCLICPSI